MLDSVAARLQSDRRLGAPNLIFQAGEGSEVGGDDIRVRAGLPVDMGGGIIRIMSTVSFDVVEILNT